MRVEFSSNNEIDFQVEEQLTELDDKDNVFRIMEKGGEACAAWFRLKFLDESYDLADQLEELAGWLRRAARKWPDGTIRCDID